jgi:hypothetical protein
MDTNTPREPIMQFFRFDHLPPDKQATSKPFGELAEHIHATLPRNPERTVALRKLLEAKDAAVRAGFMVLMALFCIAALPAAAAGRPAPEFVIASFEHVPDVPGVRALTPNTIPQTLAQAPTPAAPEATVSGGPSLGQRILDMLFSKESFATIVLVLGGLLGKLGWDEVRRRRVALGVYHAFHIVEDLAAETENKIDDKVAEALKQVDAYLLASGWRPLKPGEQEVAKLGFTSLNGASKLVEKVQANAISSSAIANTLDAKAALVPPTAG